MELKQIKDLMAAMGRTGTKKLVIKEKGVEIEIEREESFRSSDATLRNHEFTEEPLYRLESSQRASAALSRGKDSMTSLTGEAATGADVTKSHLSEASYITSPMVGTYYSAATPEDRPFIKVGDHVTKDSVVCIIEAMKVMNEIKAGITGVISEVLIENGHPVEFGSKLFRISIGNS